MSYEFIYFFFYLFAAITQLAWRWFNGRAGARSSILFIYIGRTSERTKVNIHSNFFATAAAAALFTSEKSYRGESPLGRLYLRARGGFITRNYPHDFLELGQTRASWGELFNDEATVEVDNDNSCCYSSSYTERLTHSTWLSRRRRFKFTEFGLRKLILNFRGQCCQLSR